MNILTFRNWWLVGLKGLAMLMLGLFCMALPVESTQAMLMVLAVFIAVGGGLMLAFGFSNPNRLFRNWFLLEGLLDIAIAGLILFYPDKSAEVVAVIFGVWLLLSALFLLNVARRRYRFKNEWKLPLGNGLLTLVMSIAIIFYPISGVILFGYILGITVACYGMFLIIGAYRLWRNEPRRIVVE